MTDYLDYLKELEEYHKKRRVGLKASYVPSPQEIQRRKWALVWMRGQGFSNDFVRLYLTKEAIPLHIIRFLVEIRKMPVSKVEELLKDIL